MLKEIRLKVSRYSRARKKECRVLTKEEQAKFFEASKGTFYDNLFVVAINTGLRQGVYQKSFEKAKEREKERTVIDFDAIMKKA